MLWIGALLTLFQISVADEDITLCCHSCEAPKVRYYSVDSAHGHCGECCMDPAHYDIFKVFEPNLTFGSASCADLGYPRYDTTVTHGVWPLTMTLDLYNANSSSLILGPQDMETLYKIENGECGQATLDKKYAKYAADFAGLKEGLCSVQGYSEAAGTKDITVPVIGAIKIDLFKKPSESQSAYSSSLILGPQDTETLYIIENDECGQATLDKEYAKYAIDFAGLQEGLCSEQGYTEAAGNKNITVPVLGAIKIELFKKPSASQFMV